GREQAGLVGRERRERRDWQRAASCVTGRRSNELNYAPHVRSSDSFPTSCRDRDSRRHLFRFSGWKAARLRQSGGQDRVGLRHGPELFNGEWRSRSWWFSEWSRRGSGWRNGVHELRLQPIRRSDGNVLLAFYVE